MIHPLAGARAKIERAHENIRNLTEECKSFLEKHYRHDLIGYFDPHTSDYIVSYPPVPNAPVRIAVLVGEILHLLRSSLDHVVGQLVLLNNPSSTLSGCQFPICRNAKTHRETDCGKVACIPDGAATAIMKLQPCYGRREPLETHLLAVLNYLNNRDKHRLLIPLSGISAPSKWDVQVTAKGSAGFSVHFPKFGSLVNLDSKNPTPLGHIHILPSGRLAALEVADVKVKQKFSLNLVIDIGSTKPDPKPMISLLQHMERFIYRVVRDFGRFF